MQKGTEPTQPRQFHFYQQKTTGLFAIALLMLAGLYACSNDNNIAGASFVQSGQNIAIDTLEVTDFELVDLLTYTGNLSVFSAGRFTDPVLGTIESTAFLAPGINSVSSSDSVHAGAEVYLVLHPFSFYGDTTQTATFNLHFIEQRWRPVAIRKDSEIAFNPAPFGQVQFAAGTDSVLFQMPQQWADEYRDFFNEEDSPLENVRENLFGFALVPAAETNAIVSFQTEAIITDSLGNRNYTGTRLLVVNPEVHDDDDNGGEDSSNRFFPSDNGDDNGNGDIGNGGFTDPFPNRQSFSAPFRGNGFNTLRSDIPGESPDVISVFNTFEQVLRLNLNLDSRDFSSQAVSRAELLLFEDLGPASVLPEGQVRSSSGRLQFYVLNETERNFEVIKLPLFEPPVRESDLSYRVNVTEFIQTYQLGRRSETEFFITSGPNNGQFTPAFLAAPGSGERAPKLIITRINPEK